MTRARQLTNDDRKKLAAEDDADDIINALTALEDPPHDHAAREARQALRRALIKMIVRLDT